MAKMESHSIEDKNLGMDSNFILGRMRTSLKKNVMQKTTSSMNFSQEREREDRKREVELPITREETW